VGEQTTGRRFIHERRPRALEERDDQARAPPDVGEAETPAKLGPPRLFPGREPQRTRGLGGSGESRDKVGPLELEQAGVVAVVVAVVLRGLDEVALARRRPVRLERLRRLAERLREGGEGELDGVAHAPRRPRRDRGRDLPLEARDELTLPAGVEPGLSCLLPVVVRDGVERHVGVGYVVAEHRRSLQGERLVAGPEGCDKVPVGLAHAPREASLLGRLRTVAAPVLALVPREPVDGGLAKAVEIEEMVDALFLMAGQDPEVGVGGVGLQVLDVAGKEVPQRGRQGENRLLVNKTVGGTVPRPGGRGEGERGEKEGRDGAGGH